MSPLLQGYGKAVMANGFCTLEMMVAGTLEAAFSQIASGRFDGVKAKDWWTFSGESSY